MSREETIDRIPCTGKKKKQRINAKCFNARFSILMTMRDSNSLHRSKKRVISFRRDHPWTGKAKSKKNG